MTRDPTRKPIDEMTDAEYEVFWDAIARRGEQPFSAEEKAKLHEGGVSIFGIYPPDVDYLIEETADGENYLWQDGERLRRLEPGEGETPLPPPTKPLTLAAARRIEALKQGRANNALSGLEMPEHEFRRLCQLAR